MFKYKFQTIHLALMIDMDQLTNGFLNILQKSFLIDAKSVEIMAYDAILIFRASKTNGKEKSEGQNGNFFTREAM